MAAHYKLLGMLLTSTERRSTFPKVITHRVDHHGGLPVQRTDVPLRNMARGWFEKALASGQIPNRFKLKRPGRRRGREWRLDRVFNNDIETKK